MEPISSFTHSEGSFVNARGHKLYTQTYTPLEKPRGVIIYIHGLADYSGRYHDFMKFLVEKNFIVHAYDLQSHGKSEGPANYIHHIDHVLEDTEQFCVNVKQISPILPHIAIGYSLGGLAVAHVSLKQPNLLDGLVLVAPSNRRPPFVTAALLWTLSFVAPILPWLRPRPMDITTMTRNKPVFDEYVKDPLVWHCNLPLLFAYTSIKSGTELVENSANLKVPYLLLQGTGDQIVSLDGALELHRLSGSTDKTFVGMRGLYHELLHEPEWKSIYDIILGWLDARVSADGAPTFVSKPTDKTDYVTPDGNGGFE